MIINDDCLNALKDMDANSIDAVITDPPYGYSFMGKNWDKAVPSVDIWRECLRVLKPGGWCMVMSAPRSDVQNAMISRLMESGFKLDFTPNYWTYASGFPKAGNVGKLVDKRLGAEREVLGRSKYANRGRVTQNTSISLGSSDASVETKPASDQAKALDGSYTGFQPKPAVEVVIVAMKPLSEKTYVDQALKNGKGITWLDNCRVPADQPIETGRNGRNGKATFQASEIVEEPHAYQSQGRFPANLLVSDEILNGHSKYFDLDAWADTLPFLAVPKASKSEKDMGLGGASLKGEPKAIQASKNHHPTVKPLKLMSYLITLTTRENDVVLDPFVGSGTTVVAAAHLNRQGIGIEREEEYAKIAEARLKAAIAVETIKQINLLDTQL